MQESIWTLTMSYFHGLLQVILFLIDAVYPHLSDMAWSLISSCNSSMCLFKLLLTIDRLCQRGNLKKHIEGAHEDIWNYEHHFLPMDCFKWSFSDWSIILTDMVPNVSNVLQFIYVPFQITSYILYKYTPLIALVLSNSKRHINEYHEKKYETLNMSHQLLQITLFRLMQYIHNCHRHGS